MAIAQLFNKRSAGIVGAVAVALAIPTWTSYQHDQRIMAGFRAEVNKALTPRVITVVTDGVTRQGFLNRGGAMPDFNFGFYNMPSNALMIAQSDQAACFYTNLRVVSGQENLPFWQKLFGGSEYERIFLNQSFSSLGNTCAPLTPPKP